MAPHLRSNPAFPARAVEPSGKGHPGPAHSGCTVVVHGFHHRRVARVRDSSADVRRRGWRQRRHVACLVFSAVVASPMPNCAAYNSVLLILFIRLMALLIPGLEYPPPSRPVPPDCPPPGTPRTLDPPRDVPSAPI